MPPGTVGRKRSEEKALPSRCVLLTIWAPADLGSMLECEVESSMGLIEILYTTDFAQIANDISKNKIYIFLIHRS